MQYVLCPNCRSMDTRLEKDQSTRLYMMHCQNCQSSRSVETIKFGYHAVKRGERKKLKQ